MLTLMPAFTQTASAAAYTWDGDAATVFSGITLVTGDEITVAAGASGTLTVPDGVEIGISGGIVNNNSGNQILLNIGTGAKVNWQVTQYIGNMSGTSDNILLSGAGEFNITGEILASSGYCVIATSVIATSVNINVNSGGNVNDGGSGILPIRNAGSGTVNVNSGGTVIAATNNAISNASSGVINVNGGTVKNNSGSSPAIYASGGTVNIRGGIVENTLGNAIGMSTATVNISGGTIKGGSSGYGVYAGTNGIVNINSNLSTPIIVSGGTVGAFDKAPATVMLPAHYIWQANTAASVEGGTETNGAVTPYVWASGHRWVKFMLSGIFVNDPLETTPLTTVTDIQTAIQSALNSGDVTVTGKLTGVTTNLTINFPATNNKVTWQADYQSSGAIILSSTGTFELATGAKINLSGNSGIVRVTNNVHFVVNGEITGNPVTYVISLNLNATLTVNGGATIHNTSTGSAIEALSAASSALIFINGGTVQNNSAAGGLSAIRLNGSSALSITGGTIKNDIATTNIVAADGTSTVFYSGGDVNWIRRTGGTPMAYYTGNNGGKFSMWTAGTDLFRLDAAPALWQNTVGGTSYTYSSTTPFAGSVVAALPAGFAASVVTVNGITDGYTVNADKTVTFAGDNLNTGASGLTLAAEGTLAGGRITVPAFTTAAFGVNVTKTDVSASITFTPGSATYTGSELDCALADISGITAGANPSWTYTYTIPSDGSQTGNESLGANGKPINAGVYNVTATYEDDDNIGTATGMFTINKKPLTVSNTAVSDKVYDGTNAATFSGTPALSGVVTGDNVSLTSGAPTFADVNAGTGINVNFTAFSISGTDAGNYALTQPSGVTANISPKDISINTVASLTKTYDGTAQATAGAVTFSGLVSGESLTAGTDYTVSAEFTGGDYNAGTGNKPYTYTITMLATAITNNYNLTGGNTKTGADGTIIKATAPTGVPQTLYVLENHWDTYPFNLSTLLPNVSPRSFGTVTYSVHSVDDPNNMLFGAIVNGAVLDVYIRAGSGVGLTATIRINIASENYSNFTAEITVETVAKADVSANITFNPGSATYTGDELDSAAATISGITAGANPTWTYTYAIPTDGTETGNESLGGSGKPVNAGNYLVTAVYEDGANRGEATRTFAVNKATLDGMPTIVTAIASAGKTLADVPLTGTFTNPHDGSAIAGTLAWVLPTTTTITQGTAYQWTFTPTGADAANYSEKNGGVVLWPMAGGANVAIPVMNPVGLVLLVLMLGAAAMRRRV